jgi:predicted house-cleaning noncanonical NTP pyrophosphatase (MazG superfamily)
MQVYNKLVRDNIPAIIKESGKECDVRVLGDREFKRALVTKVVEEGQELMQASNRHELVDELGDLYEVIEKIMMVYKIDKREIDDHRIKKNISKGGFDERIFLEKVK